MPNEVLPLTDFADKRFWPKVDTRSYPYGCWRWLGARMKDGYGHLKVGDKYVRAHRFSYELANGRIPAGHEVCHRCDNPLCVRPSHLFVATHADNMRDCIAKRRHRHGERHSGAKLNEESVRTIRHWYADLLKGERPTLRSVGEIFGVCEQTVLNVINYKVWKHVT